MTKPRKARPRMYHKGRVLKTLDAVAKAIERSQYLILTSRVFDEDRPLHPSFIRGIMFGAIMRFVKGGRLFLAVRNKRKESA